MPVPNLYMKDKKRVTMIKTWPLLMKTSAFQIQPNKVTMSPKRCCLWPPIIATLFSHGAERESDGDVDDDRSDERTDAAEERILTPLLGVAQVFVVKCSIRHVWKKKDRLYVHYVKAIIQIKAYKITCQLHIKPQNHGHDVLSYSMPGFVKLNAAKNMELLNCLLDRSVFK